MQAAQRNRIKMIYPTDVGGLFEDLGVAGVVGGVDEV